MVHPLARLEGSGRSIGLFHKHGVRCQRLEAKVDCSANPTSSINCSRRNCDGLPRAELQFQSSLQVDGKQTLYDKEQLIGGRMQVPAGHVLTHTETQTTP